MTSGPSLPDSVVLVGEFKKPGYDHPPGSPTADRARCPELSPRRRTECTSGPERLRFRGRRPLFRHRTAPAPWGEFLEPVPHQTDAHDSGQQQDRSTLAGSGFAPHASSRTTFLRRGPSRVPTGPAHCRNRTVCTAIGLTDDVLHDACDPEAGSWGVGVASKHLAGVLHPGNPATGPWPNLHRARPAHPAPPGQASRALVCGAVGSARTAAVSPVSTTRPSARTSIR